MKRITLLIFLLCLILTSFGQKGDTISPCRKNWKYLKTKNPIEGELVYFLPVAECGYFISATLSVVKLIDGSLIRILQVCDTTRIMKPKIKITLLPNYKEKDIAELIPIDKLNDCKINMTYYGRLIHQ